MELLLKSYQGKFEDFNEEKRLIKQEANRALTDL